MSVREQPKAKVNSGHQQSEADLRRKVAELQQSLELAKGRCIAYGFREAAAACSVSPGFLRLAAEDPDPARQLRTVRLNRRVLIRAEDLLDWFNRAARENSAAS